MANNDLSGVIAAYLQAVDNGERPVPEDWIERYPEHADDLHRFFADQAEMEGMAGPLREVDSDAETTEGHERCETEDLPETVRYFGDYEIEREIARGGMGIVYRARQKSLNRCVALKMIRAGLFADETEVRRFKDEAEAAGNLDHPHIVPIYEVGEHEGRHYFSMKLIEGGSLSMHLPRYRHDPKAIAQLMITIAQAVHHAHQRGILHRDLKPENVLIDSQGQPHMTDFGLAKRLESKEGMTESGARVGTLHFMSPEQALGEKTLTIAVDVYGLGAILYVLLTGRPPFESENVVETLRGITENEPERPSGVDRDLETICLKCLQKEPHRRYASAGELVEDLQRYQRGEPITARPVGRREKVIKWVRRNPAMASVLTVLVLVLISGATTSTILAVLMSRRAQEATKAEHKAVQAMHKADRETQKVLEAKMELERSKDDLITSVARSLGRPLAPLIDPNKGPLPPTDPEIEALLELSETKEEKIRLRFVEESFRSSTTTRQLRDRAGYALRAAVGLDLSRRERAEQVLLKKLQSTKLSVAQRVDTAYTLATLDGYNPKTALVLASFLATETGWTVSAATAKLKPEDLGPSGLKITQALGRQQGVPLSNDKPLSALMERMKPKAAAALLKQAMTKTEDFYVLLMFSDVLADVAVNLDPQEASEVCFQAATMLIQNALLETDDQETQFHLAFWRSDLPARMKSEQLVDVATSLIQVMSKTKDARVLNELARGVSTVSERLKPEEATRVCSQATNVLLQHVSKSLSSDVPYHLYSGWSALAGKMAPRVATEVAEILTQAITKTTQSSQLQYLAQTLSDVTVNVDPEEAAEVCSRAGKTLTLRLLPSKDPRKGVFGYTWSQCFPHLAVRMKPEQIAEIASSLIQAMNKTTDPATLQGLAQPLSLVAARLEKPEQVAEIATTLSQAMKRTVPPGTLRILAENVVSITAHLEPGKATPACSQAATTLIQAMNKTMDPVELQGLAHPLALFAARLKKPEQVAEIATTLIQAMKRTMPPTTLQVLAEKLSLVTAHLEPEKATQACSQAAAILKQAIPRTTTSHDLISFSKGLSVLEGRMKNDEVVEARSLLAPALIKAMSKAGASLSSLMGKVVFQEVMWQAQSRLSSLTGQLIFEIARMESGQAASTITQAITHAIAQTGTTIVLSYLSRERWLVVAGRLNHKDAVKVANVLVEAMGDATTYEAMENLSRGLSIVVSRMEPGSATDACSRAATILTTYLANVTNPRAIPPLCNGLSDLATRVRPEQSAKIAAELVKALTQALTQTKPIEPRILNALTLRLPNLTAGLEPKQAADFLTQAINQLTSSKAVPGTSLENAVRELARRVTNVAAQMEPKEASETCSRAADILIRAMTTKSDGSPLSALSEGVATLATRMEPKEANRACSQAAAILTKAAMSSTGHLSLMGLSRGLSRVAPKMEPKEAAQACSVVTLRCTQEMTKTSNLKLYSSDDPTLLHAARWMSPEDVVPVATLVAQVITKTTDPSTRKFLLRGLSELLEEHEPHECAQRARSASTILGQMSGLAPAVSSPVLLAPTSRPFPCRLSTQQLVDLLKNPFCVGPAERVVLDHLQNRSGEKFGNVWEFVHYADRKELKLDFRSPPKLLVSKP